MTRRWARIRTRYGDRWTEADAEGRPLPGSRLYDRLPAAITADAANDVVLAQRVAVARDALGLSDPFDRPEHREFDPPHRARPVPARVPPREAEGGRVLAGRVQQAKTALYGGGVDAEVAGRVDDARLALRGEQSDDDMKARVDAARAALSGRM